MIAALALGADSRVYAVTRAQGTSTIAEHTATSATVLYSTTDTLRALWVSPNRVIHAAGKRHHTNLGGAWTTAKPKSSAILALWGVADDDLFTGGVDGELMRFTQGAWTQIAAHDDMICGIHGTSASNVYIGGDGVLWRFDGKTVKDVPTKAGLVQGVYCAGREVWVCGASELYRDGKLIGSLGPGSSDELYGVGVGTAGVFAQGPATIFELAGTQLVPLAIDERALIVKRAEYSTSMVCNGTRVVAGGARSVLVNDGSGFVEWPPIGGRPAMAKPAKAKAPAKAKPKAR